MNSNFKKPTKEVQVSGQHIHMHIRMVLNLVDGGPHARRVEQLLEIADLPVADADGTRHTLCLENEQPRKL